MEKGKSAWVLLFISATAAAQFDECLDQFADQTPPWVGTEATGGQANFRDICFDSFAVLHSGNSRTPVYAAMRMDKIRLEDARFQEREGKFYPEARLPEDDRAYPEDYANSGYHRGHLAAAFDMPTPQAMAQSFSMANIIPQAPANNTGLWKRYENFTRKHVLRSEGDVFYVISGPVFCDTHKSIGDGRVWVPDFLYKLVFHQSSGRAWAYWAANADSAEWKRITYSDLVALTGIEFLPGSWPGD